jgi:hypothetical protein
MTDDLKKPQLRAVQYYYVDGSFEFTFGLLCLILSVYFYVETHVQGWLSAVVDLSLVLVMIGGGVLANRLIRRLKERVTYPRSGYVSYERKPGAKRGWRILLGMVLGGAMAALATVLVSSAFMRISVMPLLTGLLFGLVFAFLGWRAAIRRFYLLALLSAALSLLLAFSRLENMSALVVYYAAMALTLLLAGACVLRTYLRRNPLPVETPDE